ncbi:competence type IV pilus assembly protein ComGB [Bacillaceae bacterium W0354]
MRLALHRFRVKNLSLNEQIYFLDRLTKLLEKNYTFKRSLQMMTYDPEYSQLATKFIDLLHKGNPVEHCFRYLKFESTVVAYMYFTKEAGDIIDQIRNCNELLKMKAQFKQKLQEIIRYPLFLLIISLVLFIFMSTYLFPLYRSMLNHMNSDQSMTIFYSVDLIFKIVIISILSLVLISMIIYYFIYKKLSVPQQIIWIKRLPIVSKLYSWLTSMQFAYHISSILQSGRNIKEALNIMNEQHELKVIQYYSNKIIQDLSKGHSLPKAIEPLELIERELKLLIQRSDEDGTLLRDLQAYAALVLATVDQKIKRLILIIQPTLYSIIGIFIVLIYFFALFPMFQIIQQI